MNRRAFLLSIPGFCCAPMLAGANDGDDAAVIAQLAVSEFAALGAALRVDPAGLASPKVELHPTFVTVTSAAAAYSVDVSGNQTFRPAATLPYIAGAGSGGGDPYSLYTVLPEQAQVESLRQTVSALARRLGRQDGSLAKTILKKEVVIAGACGGEMLYRDGRMLARMVDNGSGYFQILCNRAGQPIRIDTCIQTDACKHLTERLLHRCASEERAAPREGQAITLGAFFDPDEYRFETGAYAYEGEQFLNPADLQNPFKHSDFTGSPVELRVNGVFDAQRRTDLVDHAAWRKTDDYRFWAFYFWNQYGRVGGVRGNWNRQAMAWDSPGARVMHRNLKSYGLVGGEPTERHDIVLSDGMKHAEPFGTSRQFVKQFYDDLEICTVAAFLTHGGPIRNRFQIRRGLDVWVVPAAPDAKLGDGGLRHVIFEGCGAMGIFRDRGPDARYQSLTGEWLPAKYVDGLRTACGGDGNLDTSGCGGWRFFEKYNKGDSISDAWLQAMMNESPAANSPVTVAYGANLTEALTTLADGRFNTQKAVPKLAAASVWTAV